MFNASALISLGVSSTTFALASQPVGNRYAAPCGVLAAMSVSFLLGDRVIFRAPPTGQNVSPRPTSNVSTRDVDRPPRPGTAPDSQLDPPPRVRVDCESTIGRGISMFLPAYNEAANLPSVVAQTLCSLEAITPKHHLIVVNDGSHDDTVAVTERLAASYAPRLSVVSHQHNLGYGHALRSGFDAGLRQDGDWIGFMDSDGQFDAGQLALLIEQAHRERADLVVGFRKKRADGLMRLITGRAWHFLTRLVVGIDVRDVDCGFKIVHRSVFRQVTLRGSFAAVSPELLVKARRAGFRTAQIGVDHYPRRAGEQTGANLGVILRSLLGLVSLRLSLSRRPADAVREGHPGSARPPRATGVALVATAMSVLSFGYFYARGVTLAYDDSISHLLIARRTLRGSTPGLAQLGSVWLPLPHLLMAPLSSSNYLFYSGIGGSIVSMLAFIATAVLIFKTGALMTMSRAGGWVAALIFIANPNVLYLQSTPMTETLLFACMAWAVYELLRWSVSNDWRHLAMCALATLLATLTRYEGWVLLVSIVFGIAIVMLRRRMPLAALQAHAIFFLTLAASGIVGWLLWNRVIFGSFLNFENGKFAKSTLWVSTTDRTTGHLGVAARTYLIAMTENVGMPFIVMAVAGIGLFLWRTRTGPQAVAPLTLLSFLPFFVLALYTGQRPLHVTQVSGDLYNTRFGLVMLLPAALFGAVTLVTAGRAAHSLTRHVHRDLVTVAGRRIGKLVTAISVCAMALLVTAADAGAVDLEAGVVTLNEPLHWNVTRRQAMPAATALHESYQGGLVLMQGFGNEYVTFASRIPLDKAIYEGSYRLWEPALHDPAAHGIALIYMSMSRSDQVWQALNDSPMLRPYQLIYDDGTHLIYRIRTSAGSPVTHSRLTSRRSG